MNKIIPAIITLALCACSMTPNKTEVAREWRTADCSGASGWLACNQKAESACPKGFDVANREENMMTGLKKFEFSCR